jgi:hypothetical protein
MKIRPLEAVFFHADGQTDRRTGSRNEADSRIP